MFDPFRILVDSNLKKTRQTATDNISLFQDLYKYYSDTKPNDYQYAIFRKNYVDNLYLASFCGADITSKIKDLEKQDSCFFSSTYKGLRDRANTVNTVIAKIDMGRKNYLDKIRGILQKLGKNHK